MKDSGIEWTGTIPDTWEVQRFKNVMHKDKKICEHYQGQAIISLTMNGVIKRDLENPSGKMPTTWDGYQFVEPEDLLLCLFDIDVTPRCVGLVKDAGLTSPAYSRFKVHKGYFNAYYDYLLRWIDDEKIFIHLSKNLRSSLSEDDFGAIHTIVPPLPEQQKIATFLDKKCQQIDSVLEKTRESIEEYKKLKHAVITQVVTKGIRPNRKMKDSGIEWIGEVPEDWNCFYLFQIFNPIKNKNINSQEKNLLSLSYGKIVRKNIETTFGLLPESFDGYNIIQKDDIVLRLTDLQNDHKSLRVGLAKETGIITSAYLSLRMKSKGYANYYYYLLHNFDILKGFYGMGAGVRQGLNWSEVRELRIAAPVDKKEQKEITDYLDKKCSQIDNLISKKEQLITELETYKKSLIYEYVTGKKEVL